MYERLNITPRKTCTCKDTGETIYLPNEIDYKELLIKYIKHVKKCVRADYIFVTTKGMNAVNGNLVIFTDEEISELNKLAENG